MLWYKTSKAYVLLFSTTAMLRVISAVLLFGNMKFQQDRKSDQATLPDNTGEVHLQMYYSEICLKLPLKNKQNKGLKAMW